MKKITVSGLELLTVVRCSSNNMPEPTIQAGIPEHTITELASILATNE